MLKKPAIKRKLDDELFNHASTFSNIFNEAKHNMCHEKDSHLFSINDAILAYFIARKLALPLYPLAYLTTNLERFKPGEEF